MFIFAVLIIVSMSSIAVNFITHSSAMTMRPGNQTATMNKNLSSGNMTRGSSANTIK